MNILKGDRLKELRLNYNWTQEDLARNSGVKIATIQKLEAGYNNIRKAQFDTLYGLARAFGVSIEYLVGVSDVA